MRKSRVEIVIDVRSFIFYQYIIHFISKLCLSFIRKLFLHIHPIKLHCNKYCVQEGEFY